MGRKPVPKRKIDNLTNGEKNHIIELKAYGLSVHDIAKKLNLKPADIRTFLEGHQADVEKATKPLVDLLRDNLTLMLNIESRLIPLQYAKTPPDKRAAIVQKYHEMLRIEENKSTQNLSINVRLINEITKGGDK